MMKRYCGLTVLALLVWGSPGFAQAVDPAFDNTEPATPTFLIEQAETLKNSLQESLSQTRELIAALKKQKKQSRLVQSTLASLRQLQTSDV